MLELDDITRLMGGILLTDSQCRFYGITPSLGIRFYLVYYCDNSRRVFKETRAYSGRFKFYTRIP